MTLAQEQSTITQLDVEKPELKLITGPQELAEIVGKTFTEKLSSVHFFTGGISADQINSSNWGDIKSQTTRPENQNEEIVEIVEKFIVDMNNAITLVRDNKKIPIKGNGVLDLEVLEEDPRFKPSSKPVNDNQYFQKSCDFMRHLLLDTLIQSISVINGSYGLLRSYHTTLSPRSLTTLQTLYKYIPVANQQLTDLQQVFDNFAQGNLPDEETMRKVRKKGSLGYQEYIKDPQRFTSEHTEPS